MCCQHCCSHRVLPIDHQPEPLAQDKESITYVLASNEIPEEHNSTKKPTSQSGSMRLAGSVLSGVFGAFLLAVLAATLPSLIGWNSIKVLGSSMGSQLPVGSIAVTRQIPADRIHVGDVILFSASNGGIPTLHRVIRFETVNAARLAITKGDANEHEDLTPVMMNRTGSVVQYHVPLLGFVFAFIAARATTTLLVLGPLFILYVLFFPGSRNKKSIANIAQPTLTA